MPSILRIEGDPTSWNLPTAIEPGQVTASSGPLALDVSEPLAGRLLLSPQSAGSVVFLQTLVPPHGVVPNGLILSVPCLYLPSVTGPDPHSSPQRYYTLPLSVDLAGLEADILAAMTGGTLVTVEVTGPVAAGFAVLNGGALPFVVLCPRTPKG